MKKLICISMLILFCSAALIFAGGGQAQTSGQTTLRFSWWGGDARHKATLAAIDRFEQLNPNIIIEPEYQAFDGYDAKLATQIAAGTLADIVQIVQTKLVEFASTNDIFVDFSKQSTVDYKMWDESFRQAYGNINGRLLGLSTGVSAYNIVINKNVLDKAGVPMPSAKITWDEYIALGARVHAANPNFYMMMGDKDSLNHLLRSYIRQQTGVFYIGDDYKVYADEKPYIEFFTMLRKMYDLGVIQPVETSFPYWGRSNENPAWINEEIAAIYTAASNIPGMKFQNMNLAPINIPQSPGKSHTGIVTQPSQLFAVKKGPNQNETLKFLAWLYTSEEGAVLVGDTRGTPPTQFQRDVLSKKGLLDPVIAGAVNLAVPVTDDPVPNLSENSQIYNVCQGVVEQVCFNRLTPAQAAKEIIARAQVVLDDLKRAAQ